MGVEPMTPSLPRRCSTTELLQQTKQKRVMGIEPTQLAWKARALPLSYTRKIGGERRIRTFEGVANGFTVHPL